MSIVSGLVGLVIGIVGTAIAGFFIAKNNTKKLLKAFAAVDGLPSKAKEIISSKLGR